jgi:hypothetical protein
MPSPTRVIPTTSKVYSVLRLNAMAPVQLCRSPVSSEASGTESFTAVFYRTSQPSAGSRKVPGLNLGTESYHPEAFVVFLSYSRKCIKSSQWATTASSLSNQLFVNHPIFRSYMV